MSKRKLGLLLLLASGYMTALGCSLFGPLRVPVSLSGLQNLLGLGS